MQRLKAAFPFLEWYKGVTWRTLRFDFIAGLTNAIMVLPQGVAFAMIAGMPPVNGLYAAMIMPIVTALFGSSKHMITGPATAMSIVLFAAVSSLGIQEGTAAFIEAALAITLIAGIIQLLMGWIKLGTLVNFVSHTVVIGFTAGAGILIAGKQLKYVFGIGIPVGTPFYEIIYLIGKNITQTNLYIFAVAISTIIIAIILKRINRQIPYMLLSMIGGSIVAQLVGGAPVGITFIDEIPAQLPPFHIPNINTQNWQQLTVAAFPLAMLGLIEAAAIARAIALKSQQRLNSNQEFIGQGLANIATSILSGVSGSGSFTRSGLNYQAGAKTPVAAIFAATLLMLIVLFVAPWASYLPIPAMGGIILLVGYNLVDVPHIRQIMQTSRTETVVLAVTFFSTVFLQLELAIYLGVIVSLIFYLRRTSKPNITTLTASSSGNQRRFTDIQEVSTPKTCPQLHMVRIDGALYYAAIERVADYFGAIHQQTTAKNILIVANSINFIDLAGAEWLAQEAKRREMQGRKLYISGLKQTAQDVLIKGGFKAQIGEEAFFDKKNDAITYIYNTLDANICAQCTTRIFEECGELERLENE